jgi:hypothetical protein
MTKHSVVALLAAVLAAQVFAEDRALNWQTTDTSLALCNGDKTVWKAVFDPTQPKTYIHPLATLDGEVLTASRPPDHIWHHGLWWSWKLINGLNYWEEDPKTGRSQGVNELTGSKFATNSDFSAQIELTFSYHPPEKPAVLSEARTLKISAPDARGCYRIDWSSVFTVGDQPVTLDRTPPHKKGGVAWGGYAGLSLRFPPGIKGWAFATSEGKMGAAQGNGEDARWVDFSGQKAGVAVFDHPANLRHPSPWYLNEQLPYFSPAILLNEPLELAAGQMLNLRYRVLVHPGALPPEQAGEEWKQFGE